MLYFSHFASWFVHELVVLWPSFSNSGFDSVWSVWYWVAGDGFEHVLMDARFSVLWRRVNDWRPLIHCLKGVFEADTFYFELGRSCGLQHGEAHEVVGDDVHGEFFFYHVRGFTAQDIHAQGDLYVAQEQFHSPAAAIEFGEGCGGTLFVVGQGGGDGYFLGAESGDIGDEGDVAHGKSLGHRVPLFFGEAFGRGFGFVPLDEFVARTEPFDPGQAFGAALVQTHHAVNIALRKPVKVREITKSSVCQHNVSGLQCVP